MREILFCSLLLPVVLLSQELRPCLRTLIVYDSSTQDVEIAAAADAVRVKEALGFAAGQAGISFRPKILIASQFTKKTFQKWLKTIHPSSKDTAFFYYAGRGTNRPHKKWPFIAFGAKKLISEKTVLRHLKSQKPNLAIVVFDCYKKPVTAQGVIDFSKIRKVDISPSDPRPGFKNLFLNHKGWAMWSSPARACPLGCPTSLACVTSSSRSPAAGQKPLWA